MSWPLFTGRWEIDPAPIDRPALDRARLIVEQLELDQLDGGVSRLAGCARIVVGHKSDSEIKSARCSRLR